MTRHIHLCAIRWGDMDAFAHVNNVEFLRYLEDARARMLFSEASASGVQGLADGCVVVRHEIDYARPLAWRPEPVRVETWVSGIAAASFTLCYRVCDGATDYVRASSVLAPYDLAGQRPRRLTAEERAFLAGYLEGG
ncbi:MAG: acyl-CoA thioesterase [Streptomycetales bacterium]